MSSWQMTHNPFILLCSFLHWLIWLWFHIYQKYCVPQDTFATSIKTDHSTSSSSSLHCVVLFPLLIIKAVKRVEVDRGEIATSKSQNLCKLLKRALYWFHRSTISSKLSQRYHQQYQQYQPKYHQHHHQHHQNQPTFPLSS